MKVRVSNYLIDVEKMAEFVSAVLCIMAFFGGVLFFCWPRF